MKVQFVWLAGGVAFAVTLAVVVGQRLSSEAMAVVVGVIAGVAASVPTSLIVMWVATRVVTPAAGSSIAPDRHAPDHSAEPPRIIVVPTAPVPPAYLPLNTPVSTYAPSAAARRYTVIGGDEMTDVGDK